MVHAIFGNNMKIVILINCIENKTFCKSVGLSPVFTTNSVEIGSLLQIPDDITKQLLLH